VGRLLTIEAHETRSAKRGPMSGQALALQTKSFDWTTRSGTTTGCCPLAPTKGAHMHLLLSNAIHDRPQAAVAASEQQSHDPVECSAALSQSACSSYRH